MSDIDAKPGLYPTKTRLALLRDVDAERVAREFWSAGQHADMNRRTERKVSAGIAEQEAAGWVRLLEQVWQCADVVTGYGYEVRYWKITDAGRAVLAAAESPGGTR